MEEEIRYLMVVYKQMTEKLIAKWPNGVEKISIRDYRTAVSELAVASTLEMVIDDLRSALNRHTDDGK